MQIQVRDLSKILKGYEKKWVALSSDQTKLVASAQSPEKAFQKANEMGENNPVVFKPLDSRCVHIL